LESSGYVLSDPVDCLDDKGHCKRAANRENEGNSRIFTFSTGVGIAKQAKIRSEKGKNIATRQDFFPF
jgi:hypothetical protein